MDRREFLQIGAAAAAGGLLWSCTSLRNGRVDDGITGFALIGCGRQGSDLTRNFLGVARETNVRFVAVCDVDIDRAKRARAMMLETYAEQGIKQEIAVYQYPEQLLENRIVDACIVAVPDHNHTTVALEVVKAGCDLYLEKPITFTIEEGKELVDLVRREKVIFQAGTQQRSSLYFRRVCELARQGKLGELTHVEIRLPRDGGIAVFEEMPVPQNLDYQRWLGSRTGIPYTEKRVHPQADLSRPGWMQVEDFCFGMITNWGSHMVDIAQWGSGFELSGPTRVKAQSTYEDRGIWTVHTKIEGELEYANGLKMNLVSLASDDPRDPGVKFVGTEGWAGVVRGAFEAHDRDLLRWQPEEGREILQVSKNHYADFLESIISRRDPVAPVEQAHRSNSVCLLLAKAAKEKREIRWDPVNEREV